MSPAAVALASLLVAAPTPIPPPEAVGLSPYRFDVLPHALLAVGAFSLTGLFELVVEPELAGGLRCELPAGATRCPAGGLNALDRSVVGNDSNTWRRISDVGMLGTVALAASASAIEAWAGPSEVPTTDFINDTLVIAEAAAVSTLITYVLKIAIQRPRPTHYTEGAPIGGFAQLMSFPSGHTSTTTAVATAYATTFALRHPSSPWRFVMYAGAAAVSLLTGYARIGGGRHFYTDVLAGLVVGAASGFLIPYLHRIPGS